MIRIVLAMLALLAGFAAQLSPAQARGVGASEVSVEIARSDVRLVARRAVPAIPVTPIVGRAGDCTVLMLTGAQHCAPTVMLRIDRARE